MKSIMIRIAAIAILTVACEGRMTDPVNPEASTFPEYQRVGSATARIPSVKEAAVISKLLEFVPAKDRKEFEQMLVQTNGQIEVKNNPDAQALVKELKAVRRAEAETPRKRVVPATLALVDELPHGAAGDAVVIRKAGEEDAIFLQEGSATVEAFASAITALYAARRRDGDIATANVHFAVKGASLPSHWRGDLEINGRNTLARLTHAGRTKVMGKNAKATKILLLNTR